MSKRNKDFWNFRPSAWQLIEPGVTILETMFYYLLTSRMKIEKVFVFLTLEFGPDKSWDEGQLLQAVTRPYRLPTPYIFWTLWTGGFTWKHLIPYLLRILRKLRWSGPVTFPFHFIIYDLYQHSYDSSEKKVFYIHTVCVPSLSNFLSWSFLYWDFLSWDFLNPHCRLHGTNFRTMPKRKLSSGSSECPTDW